jgi:pyruvate dehydrogenase E2 component (dihydrolipoamide acetyltransferase)
MLEYAFPDVGEGISEGTLVKWLVSEGDAIKADQPVAEVETDKAVVEIPAPADGTVAKLLYKEQDTLNVGEVIMHIDDGSGGEKKEETPKEEEKTGQPSEEKPAQQKEQTTEQPAAEKEAQETSSEILAMPHVRQMAKEQGIDLSTVAASGKHGEITEVDLKGGKKVWSGQKGTAPSEPSSSAPAKDILAAPSVRKLAREMDVDINTVSGSGENGKILTEDVKAAASGEQPKTSEKSSSAPVQAGERETVEEMSGVRKAISKKMSESLYTAPQVTHCDEVDVTELVLMREKQKEKLKEQGVKLTYMPFIVKALVKALKDFPHLNASLSQDKIIVKHYYNIGIATGTENGLLVPNVKDADKKSIVDIAKETTDLVSKAREKKLGPSDMSEGTFTITSIGSIGGQLFTPILNYPEVGILGIGTITEKPVVLDGEIVIRKMMWLSLSFDHRVIDGDVAARFCNEIKQYLEDPTLLFMEM